MIVGAEAISSTTTVKLRRRGQQIGRLLVDVDVDPAVDQTSVRSEQCPSLTTSGRLRLAAFEQASDERSRSAPTVSWADPEITQRALCVET